MTTTNLKYYLNKMTTNLEKELISIASKLTDVVISWTQDNAADRLSREAGCLDWDEIREEVDWEADRILDLLDDELRAMLDGKKREVVGILHDEYGSPQSKS